MSVFIGGVRGPNHNSPYDAGEVWADTEGVSLNLFECNGSFRTGVVGAMRRLDPVAARNLAALLVRGAEEAELMRARAQAEKGA
jgi:hypothetical protein